MHRWHARLIRLTGFSATLAVLGVRWAYAAPLLVCLPLDPAVPMFKLQVSLLKGVVDGVVAVSAIIASGARLVNIVRSVLVDLLAVVILGDPATGQKGLLPNLLPLYMLVATVAVMLVGVFMLAQWLTSYRVSSLGRIAGVLFVAGWLANSGGVVIRGYDQLRVAFGTIFYNAAREASATLDAGALGLTGGESVDVGWCVDLSRTNQPGEVPTCAGYGLAMAFIYYQAANDPLTMRPSVPFTEKYFMIPGKTTNFYFATDTEIGTLACAPADATALVNQIYNGIYRAIFSIPLAVMGLLEQIVWFLLTMSVLALFISVAINLAFAALTPFGNGLSETVNQLVQMLVKTATTAFYFGLVIGLMLVTAGNAAYFVGASLLGLAVTTGLMLQASSAAFAALNTAGGGMAQSGANAVMGVVGGAAVMRAARQVGGAVSGSSVGQYIGQTASATMRGGMDELGLHNPMPDAQTLGRNVGGHAVAVLTGQAGDSERAQQRRLAAAQREEAYQQSNLAAGPSWREELRVVQQERRKDIRVGVQARLGANGRALSDSEIEAHLNDDELDEVGTLADGTARSNEPYTGDERRQRNDRRAGIDRRARARQAAGLAPVGEQPEASADATVVDDSPVRAGGTRSVAQVAARQPVERGREPDATQPSAAQSASAGQRAPSGERALSGSGAIPAAGEAEVLPGQAALGGHFAEAGNQPLAPFGSAQDRQGGPDRRAEDRRAAPDRRAVSPSEPLLPTTGEAPWLAPARAALTAAQSKSDPARAWTDAGGATPAHMTGQMRALTQRSSDVGMTGDAFTAILAAAAQPGGEAQTLGLVEPYFLDSRAAQTYAQQARRVARWMASPDNPPRSPKAEA